MTSPDPTITAGAGTALDDRPPTASLASATLSFLVTDDELSVLLGGAGDALDEIFREAVPTSLAAVAAAVTRSLVARRALAESAPDGAQDVSLTTLEPWTSLVSAITGSPLRARVVSDGDDSRALSVYVGVGDVVSVELDPTGVNTVTFTPGATAAGVVAARIAHRDDDPPAADLPALGAPIVLTSEALADGRAALEADDLDAARAALGDAYELLLPAGVVHHLEVVRRSEAGLTGLGVDYLDAGDLGWVALEPAAGDDVSVRRLTDAELAAELAGALG